MLNQFSYQNIVSGDSYSYSEWSVTLIHSDSDKVVDVSKCSITPFSSGSDRDVDVRSTYQIEGRTKLDGDSEYLSNNNRLCKLFSSIGVFFPYYFLSAIELKYCQKLVCAPDEGRIIFHVLSKKTNVRTYGIFRIV